MPNPKIKLAILGQLPPDFDPDDLRRWKSAAFEITDIDSFQLNEDAKGEDWEFTDQQLDKYLPNQVDGGFLIILMSVKLEDNRYVRPLSNNRILFTFYQIDQILRFHSIPLKNIVLRVLYAACLVYLRYGNRIPRMVEQVSYAHDETRGCLFDMTASKLDVVYSCDKPILCEHCVAKLKNIPVSNEIIGTVQSEIKKIRKPLFHRMADFVKRHPVTSILISLSTALVVGIVASVLAAFVYDAIKAAS